MSSNNLIVLGAGHAAYSLAREYRRHDAERPIVLITRDAGDSYYRAGSNSDHTGGAVLLAKARHRARIGLTIGILVHLKRHSKQQVQTGCLYPFKLWALKPRGPWKHSPGM